MTQLCSDIVGHIVTYLDDIDFYSARLVWKDIQGDKYYMYGQYIRFLISNKRIGNKILQRHLNNPKILDLFKDVHIRGIFNVMDDNENIHPDYLKGVYSSNDISLLKKGDIIKVKLNKKPVTVLSCTHTVILRDVYQVINENKAGLFVVYSIVTDDPIINIYISYNDNDYVELCINNGRFIANRYI